MVQFSKSNFQTSQFALVHVLALHHLQEVVSVVVHHRDIVTVVVDLAHSHVPSLLSLALAPVPVHHVRVRGPQDPFLHVLVQGPGLVRGLRYLHVDVVTMVVGQKIHTVAVAEEEEAGGDEDHRHAIETGTGTIADLAHHFLLPVVVVVVVEAATHHVVGPRVTLVVDLVVQTAIVIVEVVTGAGEDLVVVVVQSRDVVVHSPAREPQEAVPRVILFGPVVHVPDLSLVQGPHGLGLVPLSRARGRLLLDQRVAPGPLGRDLILRVPSIVVVARLPGVGVGIGTTLGTVGPGLRVRINDLSAGCVYTFDRNTSCYSCPNLRADSRLQIQISDISNKRALSLSKNDYICK